MQHVDGHWIWLRVRCELSQGAADAGLHLIGIAVDITEQKSLAEKTVEADLRLRDAIETIPEAFVLWDASDRLVLCNSHFQRLHKLPDSAVTPGTSYETVIEVGRMPEVKTRLHEVANQAHGPSRRSSMTEAGCTSASAAPRTAATFRSEPTSRGSRNTNRSWSTMTCGCVRPSST
jgi:two-component system, cell cycle sensor histidine kinase PleC